MGSVSFPYTKDGEDFFCLLIFLASMMFSFRKIGMRGRAVIKRGSTVWQSLFQPFSLATLLLLKKSKEERVMKAV